MWRRKDLKVKAKEAMHANYWKSVLVGLMLAVLAGGFGSAGGMGSVIAIVGNGALQEPQTTYTSTYDFDSFDDYSYLTTEGMDDEQIEDLMSQINNNTTRNERAVLALGASIIAMIAILLVAVVSVLGCVLDALIFNPLIMGAHRFFMRNLDQEAGVKEIAFAFDSNYKQIAKTLFLRDLYVFLWSLLLIVPGIIKAYQYRMVDYLLNDDPNLTAAEALQKSKAMMQGNKWRAFVLDLSFIGWHILSGLTLGLLSIFYVAPYQNQTNAALHEALRNNG